jgi:hypothetical protein
VLGKAALEGDGAHFVWLAFGGAHVGLSDAVLIVSGL